MRLISIGPWCISAEVIQNFGARSKAYPFDWLFCSPSMVLHCIQDRFSVFLNKDYYEISDDMKKTAHHAYTEMIQSEELNRHYKHAKAPLPIAHIFNHHNMKDDATYLSFQQRCARFIEEIEDTTSPLILMYTDAYGTFENEKHILEQISNTSSHIILLCVRRTTELSESGKVEQVPNTRIWMGYYYTDQASEWMPVELFTQIIDTIKNVKL